MNGEQLHVAVSVNYSGFKDELLGLALWRGELNCHCGAGIHMEANLVLAVPLLIQLLAEGLGQQQKVTQVFGPLPLMWRPRSSWLLSSALTVTVI